VNAINAEFSGKNQDTGIILHIEITGYIPIVIEIDSLIYMPHRSQNKFHQPLLIEIKKIRRISLL